ncbi:MAG: glycosyltransferase family 4 protein [Verrucomicrobia bacterium]|nr:glycosyltransferase family 4 protein [Verrucomicrobiota bacterium]
MADVIYKSLEQIKRCGVYTVLDLDDIDSVVIRRSLEWPSVRPRTAVGRYLHNLDFRRLERYEMKIVPPFHACIVCSDIDRDKILNMRLSGNPWIIPNCVDIEYFQPGEPEDESPHDILFLGNMKYSANVDAVIYFVKEIFPRIAEKMPDCRFLAVGRNAVNALSMVTQLDGVSVVGDVSDTREFYRKAALVVTPIRFGGGTRIKVLEAMAMMKAIVSTAVGVEGIGAADGKEIVVADNEEDFAAKCVYLLGNRQVRATIGENARRLVAEKYDVNVIDKIVRGYYLSAQGISEEVLSAV